MGLQFGEPKFARIPPRCTRERRLVAPRAAPNPAFDPAAILIPNDPGCVSGLRPAKPPPVAHNKKRSKFQRTSTVHFIARADRQGRHASPGIVYTSAWRRANIAENFATFILRRRMALGFSYVRLARTSFRVFSRSTFFFRRRRARSIGSPFFSLISLKSHSHPSQPRFPEILPELRVRPRHRPDRRSGSPPRGLPKRRPVVSGPHPHGKLICRETRPDRAPASPVSPH